MKHTRVSTKNILLILIIICTILQVVPAATTPSNPEVQAAINYLKNNQNTDGSINDYGTTCWAAIAIKAANLDPNTFNSGGNNIAEYLVNNANSIDKNDVSQLSRFILAMSASNLDASKINGYNYVAKLQSLLNSGQYGDPTWLFDDYWPVIALCSARVPSTDPSIAEPINFIVTNQNLDGGWGWIVGGVSDVDDTAGAVMALRASGMSYSDTVIQDALNYLRSQQIPDGGFPSWGASNSDSDSWGISALYSADEDPITWLSGGNSPIDHLQSLQNPDGSFSWQSAIPGFNQYLSTSYSIVALSGKHYPTGFYTPTQVKDPDNSKPSVSFSIRVNQQNTTTSIQPEAELEFTNFDIIEFADTSSDPDGNIKRYEWIFFGRDADPLILYSPSFTHRFEDPGYYRLRHRIWDNKGKRAQKDYLISVEEGTPPAVFSEVYHIDEKAIVSLRASQGSSVAEIWYIMDGGKPVNLLFGPPIIQGSGEHTLFYWCIDENGNKGTPEEIKINI